MVLSLFNFLLCFLFSPSAFSAPKVYYVAYVARFRFSTPRLMVKGGFCLFLHSLSCCLYFDEHFKNNFGHFCMPFRTCKKKSLCGFCKKCDGSGVSSLPKNGYQLFAKSILELGWLLTLGGDWQKEVVGSTGLSTRLLDSPGPVAESVFWLSCLAPEVSFVLVI